MTTDLKEREERIRALKENIIGSVNRKVAEAVSAVSAREKNLLLNDFEYAMGRISLDSSPEGIGIGAHQCCNAKCVFCLGGKHQIFTPERYKNFFEQKLESFISKARYVNLCGFGELLLMPGIEKFLDYLNEKIPHVNKIFTTNGSPLTKEVSGLLMKSKSVVEISLHASNGQLHRLLTRTDSFEQIVRQIKQLVSLRKNQDQPSICLVFLANTLNIENLPDFVEFCSRLGVDEVICNYMTVFNAAQLKLSCFFKQEITNDSLSRARELAEKLNFPIRLPPQFGLSGQPRSSYNARKAPCGDPWKYCYVENEGSVLPCCYAGYHIGYLNQADFETIWNGSFYRHLRSSLINGPVHEWCKWCIRYRSENINDIRSHVSSRPDLREKILKGYKL